MPDPVNVPRDDGVILVQGSTFERMYAWEIDGVPQDISGHAVRGQGRGNVPQNTSKLFDFLAVTVSASPAIVKVSLTALTTAGVFIPNIAIDVEVESPAGYVTRIVEGLWTLSYETTR